MANLPIRPVPEHMLRIEPFKGMNLSVTPTQIDQSQSPDMLNLTIDERGALNKRTGYERVFATSLGVGAINGAYEYRKQDGTVLFLLAHGTKLYTQSGTSQPVEIYNGLANNRVNFFTMNEKCYLLDGVNYLVYDGTTISEVEPYIPTLSVSKLPAGGGEPFEDFNLLGAGFKDSFSADGTAKDFILSLKGLDATTVTCTVDGVAKVETTDFTVDRTLGKVTFTTAPAEGINNVIITAYKTQVGYPDRIKKCTFHAIYGGDNDTRPFVSGNPDMPNYVWRLGLYDPTYAPENGFYKFNDEVRGFSKQYDYLVIHRSKGYHQVTYELVNGVASFPSKPLNDQVGTLTPYSVQIIENNPVSLSKDGVYMMVASNVRDERNVQHISENIDARLLAESNLENAVSVEFDKKYWLAVNGNVYLYDYVMGEWFFYDNIKANCFIERNGDLYFGSSEEGLLYRFMKETDVNPFNDDGEPITAFWISKMFEFGTAERKKLVEKAFFSLKPAIRTSADLYYVSNKKDRKFVKTTRMDLIDYTLFDYSLWSYATNTFPQPAANKIKAKKIVYFQLELRNDKLGEGLGILSLGIKYQYQSLNK